MEQETLSPRAEKAREAYLSNLFVAERTTKKPIVVAMIGLVGSGKSSVAKELAPLIGASVIVEDGIRVALRMQGEPYKYARRIAHTVAAEVLQRGANIILDADYVTEGKRVALQEEVGKVGAQLAFLATHMEDPVVMFGRMLIAPYQKSPDDFFGGAKTAWQEGSEQQTGAAIKIKEAWRRTPHHYNWVNEGGGRWEIKDPPCPVVADIDTTDPEKWKEEVQKVAERLNLL